MTSLLPSVYMRVPMIYLANDYSLYRYSYCYPNTMLTYQIASQDIDRFIIEPHKPLRVESKGRPDIIARKLLGYQPFVIPESIHKKMMRRWQEHIPLTYLTDRYCSAGTENKGRSKDFEVNPSGVLVSTEQPLSDTNEEKLSFEDWHKAWQRFLSLIQRYIPKIYDPWRIHFERIRDAPDNQSRWQTWLEYDISLRKNSIHEGLDPAMFDRALWYRLDLDTARQTSLHQPSNRAQQSSSRFPAGASNSRQSERSSQQERQPRSHQTRWTSPARCLLCAGPHYSRGCRSTTQTNGRPTIITSRDNGKTYADSDGNRYCFAYNGATGCVTQSCPKGMHQCTLCKGSEHGAQSCPAV